MTAQYVECPECEEALGESGDDCPTCDLYCPAEYGVDVWGADWHTVADRLTTSAANALFDYLAALREDGTTGLRVFRVGATGQRFEVRR